MKMREAAIACLLAFLGLASPAQAIIQSGFHTNLLFDVGASNVAATWGLAVTLTAGGLACRTNMPGESWIQTDRIPVGLAWRPPTKTEFLVRLSENRFPMRSGQETRSLSVRLRYGCDGVHWSPWVPMTNGYEAVPDFGGPPGPWIDQPDPRGAFTAVVSIPSAHREAYDARKAEWERTDPAWRDDQEAYCRWLLSQDKDFFRINLPFLGYVQFRIEAPLGFPGATTIRWMSFCGRWVVSGFSSMPKEGKRSISELAMWNLVTAGGTNAPGKRTAQPDPPAP